MNEISVLSQWKNEFDSTELSGCVVGKTWHLSFVEPSQWTVPEQLDFHKEVAEVEVDGIAYRTYVEYAVVQIERPWLHLNLFKLPFRHKRFARGEISNGQGVGLLPEVNTGAILTRKIRIGNIYENNHYQIVGWIVRNIPLCPR